MERPFKERLVGAVVLVALIVLVVPALLSGPQEPRTTGPAAEGEPRRVEIDLAGPLPQAEPTEQDELVAAAEDTAPVEAPAVVQQPPPATAGPPVSVEAPAAVVPEEGAAAAPVAVTPKPTAPAPAAGWAVQVAALSSRDAAARLAADLKGRGYAAFVLEHRADGKLFYRVRVGPEAQRERADALAIRLKKEGFKSAVVPHP